LAETAQGLAETAQGLAETARDGTLLGAASTGYQPDTATAEGIPLADGEVFWTVEGDEIVFYQMATGTATEIPGARLLAAEYVMSRLGAGPSSLSGYAASIGRDDSGRAAIWIKNNGEVEMPATPSFSSVKSLDSALSGYSLMLGRDAAGRVPFGISSATGNPIFKGLEVDIPALVAGVPALDEAMWHTATIECWGDSLTDGDTVGVTTPYPSALAALLPDRVVNNRGLSGRTSLQVATAQGGVPSMLTVASNTIPSVGAVAVTLTQNGNFSSKGGYTPLNFTGTLFGIRGTLNVSHNASVPEDAGPSTFTRESAGSETLIPDHTPFILDTDDFERSVPVVWVGRNDLISFKSGTTSYDNDFVLGNIEAMIAAIKPLKKRFVILTTTEASWEYVGRPQKDEDAFLSILAINYEIMRRWPDNAIDVRKALVNSYDSGEAGDVTAFGRNQIPPSLQQDGLHLNDAGYAIVAGLVANFITAKGW